MNFNSQLTEAILLKRSLRFLVEVALSNRQRLMIRCPNMGHMVGCDILGSKLWYTNAVGYHCLPTWELVEVDAGHLVCINTELVKPLVIEGVKEGVIEELKDYNLLHTGLNYDQSRLHQLLLEKDGEQCYVGIEQVTLGDDLGRGYFPDHLGIGRESLQLLSKVAEDGHRAVLIFCVMHTGIEKLKPSDHIDSDYGKLLRQALAKGVEVLAYRTTITLQGISITTSLPILLSEDAVPG